MAQEAIKCDSVDLVVKLGDRCQSKSKIDFADYSGAENCPISGLSPAKPVNFQMQTIRAEPNAIDWENLQTTQGPLEGFDEDNYPETPVLCSDFDCGSMPWSGKRNLNGFFNRPLRGCTISVRGCTEDGHSLYLFVQGFRPFLLFDVCDEQEPEDLKAVLTETTLGLLHRCFLRRKYTMPKSFAQFNSGCCEICSHHDANGFVPVEQFLDKENKTIRTKRRLIKVRFESLRDWWDAKKYKQSKGSLWGSVTDRKNPESKPVWGIAPFEAYSSAELQFCEHFGLTVSTWWTVSNAFFNTPDSTSNIPRQTYCTYEFYGNMETVCIQKMVREKDVCAPFLWLSFDIESYSHRKDPSGTGRMFPSAANTQDVVTTVAIQISQPTRENENIVFCLKKTSAVPGAQVFWFDTETELIRAFAVLLQVCHPDIITGFNLSFDFKYMKDRADKFGIQDFDYLGPRIVDLTPVKERSLSSSALGDNKFYFPDSPDILVLDAYVFLKNNVKAKRYRLEDLSVMFLNDHKEDLPYNEMFRLWDTQDPQALAKIASYAVQDAALPTRLLHHKKINALPMLFKLSEVTKSSVHTILMRGQQQRVITQLVHKARVHNAVLSVRPEVQASKYPGALVLDPLKGLFGSNIPGRPHNEVVSTLDFMSLYPSIMIFYNICYSQMLNVRLCEEPNRNTGCYTQQEFDEFSQLKYLPRNEYLVKRQKALEKLVHVLKEPNDGLEAAKCVMVLMRANCLLFSGPLPPETRENWVKADPWFVDKAAQALRNGCPPQGHPAQERHPMVVYGDTDSIFVLFTFPKNDETDQEMCVAASLRANSLADAINMHQKASFLEVEKFAPIYVSQEKKRYVGLFTEDIEEEPTLKATGISIVRRDLCPLASTVVSGVVREFLNCKDLRKAINLLVQTGADLRTGNFNPDDLILTKSLRDLSKYANDNQPHIMVARAIAKRRGIDPSVFSGSRVGFLLCVRADKKAKVCEMAEDPEHARKHGIPIDLKHYYQKQMLDKVKETLDFVQPGLIDASTREHMKALEKKVALDRSAVAGNSLLTTFFQTLPNKKPLSKPDTKQARFCLFSPPPKTKSCQERKPKTAKKTKPMKKTQKPGQKSLSSFFEKSFTSGKK